MTKRTPDFYRVVRVDENGDRMYLNQLNQFAHGAHNAFPFRDVSLAQDDACRYHARIVPVYVKVTRKPKLHDFGWALRRMREGKRVRRASAHGYLLCARDVHLAVKPDQFREVGPGGMCDVTEFQVSAIAGTDWQLYEPEVGP